MYDNPGLEALFPVFSVCHRIKLSHRPRGACDCAEETTGARREVTRRATAGDCKNSARWSLQELSGPVFRGFQVAFRSPGRGQRVTASTQLAEATPEALPEDGDPVVHSPNNLRGYCAGTPAATPGPTVAALRAGCGPELPVPVLG